MARDVPARLHGHHVFRQAHVAANVETLLRDGPTLHPRTYNADVVGVFDLPLYQLAVAGLARVTGAPPLALARIASLVIFALTIAVLGALLRATAVPWPQRVVALALFATAPLNLFYDVAPMEDGLAVLLSYLSLRAFVSWTRGRAAGAWLEMVGTGMVAALIKPPVYLGVFVAVAWCWSRGPRASRRAMLAYVAAIGVAVAAFLAYSLTADASAQELVQGSPLDRLQPAYWAAIGRTTLAFVLNPVTFGLALIGLAATARRRAAHDALYVGLALGSAVTVLAFFSRFRWHDYYQLPLVFPLAFFAASGFHHLLLYVRAGRALRTVAFTLLAAVCVVWTRAGYAELARSEWVDAQAAAGEWLENQTTARDFIVYLVDGPERDYSPAFLYFASRDGYNLWRPAELTRPKLAEIRAIFGTRYRRILLFCPQPLARAAGARLRALGAPVVAEGEAGRLYDLTAEPEAVGY
jgi:hypothetical protein